MRNYWYFYLFWTNHIETKTKQTKKQTKAPVVGSGGKELEPGTPQSKQGWTQKENHCQSEIRCALMTWNFTKGVKSCLQIHTGETKQ